MYFKKIFKPAIIVVACLIFLPLVLFAGILIALTIPSVQQKAATAAARILTEKTSIEVSVGHFSVRPPFDTFLFGADFSLNFPYIQLGKRVLRYIGQTSYRLGYLNQNISGNYGMHKLYGGVDYSFLQNKYITQSFSPTYLSVVLAAADIT